MVAPLGKVSTDHRSSHRRCSVRKGVLRVRKIHRKTPAPISK